MLPFARVAVIGMGLIGSSLTRAIRATMPTVHLTVHDADAGVRERVLALDLADDVTDTPGAAVIDADLAILALPVLAMMKVAAAIRHDLPAGCVVSDTGSVKGSYEARMDLRFGYRALNKAVGVGQDTVSFKFQVRP